jgi:ppGpp synthetase/RelA/SpoT-type nucleotidyltranferase
MKRVSVSLRPDQWATVEMCLRYVHTNLARDSRLGVDRLAADIADSQIQEIRAEIERRTKEPGHE